MDSPGASEINHLNCIALQKWSQLIMIQCLLNKIFAKQKGPLIERPFSLLININYLRRLVFLSIPELGKLLYFFLPLPTGEPMRIIAQRNPMLD
jgi:hypothetical protein